MVDYNRLIVYSPENREVLPVYPQDVYWPTDKTEAEINGSSTTLSPEALQLLVLVDGKANVGDIEQQLPHIPADTLRNLLRDLLRDGLLRQATIAEETGIDLDSFFAATAAPAEPSAGAKASADQEAESGGPALQRDGYYVSIARQAAGTRKPGAGKTSVLLIDDDPDFCSLVERVLVKAGFEMRIATNRAEIVAELRKLPLPDLVLLDVMLPDANGFDILQRMKQVPALKTTPVIMTTAEATRASVMRGLVGGADGYLTKPFKTDILLKGVRTVLGIG